MARMDNSVMDLGSVDGMRRVPLLVNSNFCVGKVMALLWSLTAVWEVWETF